VYLDVKYKEFGTKKQLNVQKFR